MTTILELLIVLATLPVPMEHSKETKEQRLTRLRPVANAIHGAAERATCSGIAECTPHWPGTANQAIAALISAGWWESRFAQHVIDGKCRPYECDPIKLANGTIFHKAAGAWQQQVAGPILYAEWKTLPGNPEAQAWAAVRVLASSKRACKTTNGMFSMYATGRWCGWKHSAARVRTYQRILGKLSEGKS